MKKVQIICASSLVTKMEGRNTLMEGVREQLLQETEYARAEKRLFLTVNYMDLDLNYKVVPMLLIKESNVLENLSLGDQ